MPTQRIEKIALDRERRSGATKEFPVGRKVLRCGAVAARRVALGCRTHLSRKPPAKLGRNAFVIISTLACFAARALSSVG